jgi:hypothetical protein
MKFDAQKRTKTRWISIMEYPVDTAQCSHCENLTVLQRERGSALPELKKGLKVAQFCEELTESKANDGETAIEQPAAPVFGHRKAETADKETEEESTCSIETERS